MKFGFAKGDHKDPEEQEWVQEELWWGCDQAGEFARHDLAGRQSPARCFPQVGSRDRIEAQMRTGVQDDPRLMHPADP